MTSKSIFFISLKIRIVSILCLYNLFNQIAYAQLSRDSTDLTVKQVAESLIKRYIDPDQGLKMSDLLTKNLKSGKYYKLRGKELANKLTLDIRNIIDDRHLTVYYSDRELESLNGFATQFTEKQQQERLEALKKENFGIQRVAILPGDIGFIDFKYFGPLDYVGEKLVTAMDSLCNTNALIIDLRKCTGSMSEDFNMMFPGYFLQKSVQLGTMNFRSPKPPKQNWSYGYVPGIKYLGKPVYILTSGSTFSGAEALAYDLQSLKRVTIIGDITGGAANPVGSITLNKHFGINMPEAYITNLITKTNWEGVGVIPDIKVAARDALRLAQLTALDSLIKTNPSKWKPEYASFKERLINEQSVDKIVKLQLSGYPTAKSVSVTGDFNYWAKHSNQLKKDKSGVWSIDLAVPKGKLLYQFVIDNLSITDPSNPHKEGNLSVKIVE